MNIIEQIDRVGEMAEAYGLTTSASLQEGTYNAYKDTGSILPSFFLADEWDGIHEHSEAWIHTMLKSDKVLTDRQRAVHYLTATKAGWIERAQGLTLDIVLPVPILHPLAEGQSDGVIQRKGHKMADAMRLGVFGHRASFRPDGDVPLAAFIPYVATVGDMLDWQEYNK